MSIFVIRKQYQVLFVSNISVKFYLLSTGLLKIYNVVRRKVVGDESSKIYYGRSKEWRNHICRKYRNKLSNILPEPMELVALKKM